MEVCRRVEISQTKVYKRVGGNCHLGILKKEPFKISPTDPTKKDRVFLLYVCERVTFPVKNGPHKNLRAEPPPIKLSSVPGGGGGYHINLKASSFQENPKSVTPFSN